MIEVYLVTGAGRELQPRAPSLAVPERSIHAILQVEWSSTYTEHSLAQHEVLLSSSRSTLTQNNINHHPHLIKTRAHLPPFTRSPKKGLSYKKTWGTSFQHPEIVPRYWCQFRPDEVRRTDRWLRIHCVSTPPRPARSRTHKRNKGLKGSWLFIDIASCKVEGNSSPRSTPPFGLHALSNSTDGTAPAWNNLSICG